jgi:WD40 repeat protein
MGRQERPLDPTAGPVQRFAFELRKLRAEAGGPTYRELARRTDYSLTTLSQAASGDQLPSLPVTLAYVTACGGDPEHWERRWHETSAEVTEQALREPEPPDTTSPYQGLARFEPTDHHRYFGRDTLIADLLALTRAHRFTAVFGPSGSGKSSLLRAGLIPALQAETEGAGVAALRILTPGEHPLRTHEKALSPKENSAGDTVIVVDQFEEVFTLCRATDERTEFIQRLLSARSPDSRLRVVIAVRADFYGRCAEHRDLADALRDANLLVGPMTPAELREAVVRPAQSAGLIVERELTARLVAEVKDEPGGLPLLSHVLRETWRRRKGRALTLAAYEAAGGVHGAIAQTAEEMYKDLSPDQAALARLILLRLITPGDGAQDTRHPVDRAELDFASPAEVTAVLDRLTRARLLTLDDHTVDLAHEALITAWPRLSGWIDEARDRLRTHRQLTEAARAWDDLGRDPGALYRGTRLATATERLTDDGSLTRVERDFLTAGTTAHTADLRRRRTLLTTLATLLVLALLAGVTAWQQSRTSDRRHVEAEARRIAAVADSMRFADPVRAIQLRVAAWELAQTTETRSALLASITQPEHSTLTVPGATSTTPPTEERVTTDGRTVISVSPDSVRTWDLRARRLTHTYAGIGELQGRDDTASGDDAMEISPDGRTLALSKDDGVHLWDVRTGRVTGRVATADAPPDSAIFGRSSRTLVVRTARFPSDIEVWDVRTHRLRMKVRPPADAMLQDAVISPDDRRLAICTSEHPLEVWDIVRHRKLSLPWAKKLGPDSCTTDGLTFSPDGDTLAMTTDSGTRRWNLRTGDELRELETGRVDALRFSADGRFLVTSDTAQIQVWRLSAPETLVFHHRLVGERPEEFEFDLAAGALRYRNGHSASFRSLRLGPAVTTRWAQVDNDEADLAPDGRTLAVRRGLAEENSTEDSVIQLLDTGTGRVVDTPPTSRCSPVVAYGVADVGEVPQGGTETDDDTGADDDTEVEEPSAESEGPDCSPHSAWSGNGRYYAYGLIEYGPSDSGSLVGRQRITVWDTRTHRVHATLLFPTDESGSGDMGGIAIDSDIDGIALSPDGDRLLVGRTVRGTAVEVWDISGNTQAGKSRREEPPRPRRTAILTGMSGGDMAVRHDEGLLVSGHEMIATLPSGTAKERALSESGTNAIAFSPDGSYFAAGDDQGRVTLWNGDLSERLGILAGTSTGALTDESDAVSALAFSPDGNALAVATGSGTVRLWDTASSSVLGTALPTPGDSILSLAFTSDGRALYTAGAHVRLQRHDLTPAHLVREACTRAGSGLSPADWKTYLPDIPYRRTC